MYKKSVVVYKHEQYMTVEIEIFPIFVTHSIMKKLYILLRSEKQLK